jgi:hypothetical protein
MLTEGSFVFDAFSIELSMLQGGVLDVEIKRSWLFNVYFRGEI